MNLKAQSKYILQIVLIIKFWQSKENNSEQ